MQLDGFRAGFVISLCMYPRKKKKISLCMNWQVTCVMGNSFLTTALVLDEMYVKFSCELWLQTSPCYSDLDLTENYTRNSRASRKGLCASNSMFVLYDVFLLNIVVRLQWANGFSFLVFLIDYIAGYCFPFCVEKEWLGLGPCGPLGQLFLCGLESIVYSVMLFVLFPTDDCLLLLRWIFCFHGKLTFFLLN